MKSTSDIGSEEMFIAVECFQCSTMQVKQSSNKWKCVVCNEKQSVRKVFAQAFMAKDVRKFVQSFNMSRQFVEQEETLVQQQTGNKKRTDWSEYVADQSGLDTECVTQPLFKKPKFSNNTRPLFGNRAAAAGKEIVKGTRVAQQHYGTSNSAFCHDDTGSTSVMVKLKKRPVSKWNDFIDESGCEEINAAAAAAAAAFQTKLSDEIVQDDVYPHFMS